MQTSDRELHTFWSSERSRLQLSHWEWLPHKQITHERAGYRLERMRGEGQEELCLQRFSRTGMADRGL